VQFFGGMARESDSKYQNPNPGYRKGDEHSGGGGYGGAGGKKRRPTEGWEKADIRRDMDSHSQARMPASPKNKEPPG
jgi:hypothetical protein